MRRPIQIWCLGVLAFALASRPDAARAQRLLVINCDDGELRSWPGWIQIDTVSSLEFVGMTPAQVAAYDVLEVSHCVDAVLTSGPGRAKISASIRAGASLYATLFNADASFLPGSIQSSSTDTCGDAVVIPAAATSHPLITFPNPDVTSADLSNVGCALHGSFAGVSAGWETIATSGASGNPVMIAAQIGCGRVFARSHHFHSNTEPRAVRFTDSVARWLLAAPALAGADGDNDGVDNACDNCPNAANAGQYDCDGDRIGDACEATLADADNDDIDDACDTCPNAANAIQGADNDNDGIDNACDNCPNAANPAQSDCNTDGTGDTCSTDTDGDRVPDPCDNCPNTANPLQYDTDNDNTGDNCDLVVRRQFLRDYFDDVSLFHADPNTNTNFPSLQIHGTTTGANKMALMRFDTRDIPAGAEIVHAELDLFQTVKVPITVTAHYVLEPWVELQATWNNFNNAFDPVPFQTHQARLVDQNVRIQMDFTAPMRAWFSGERTNYGYVFRTSDEGVVRFGATERTAAQRRPEMYIDYYVPEPKLTLLVAQGAAGRAGSIYQVNGVTGAAVEIGRVGFGVTAMATAPDGTIYATTATQHAYGELITIDPRTGAGTTIAALDDARTNHAAMPDCTFSGAHLYCWTERGDQAAIVDEQTGEVNLLGGGVYSWGSGMAADASGTIYLAPHGSRGELYTVDRENGRVTEVAQLRGTRETIAAMTFSGGILFAIEHDGAEWALVTIDPVSGDVATIALLPPYVDAIATLGYNP